MYIHWTHYYLPKAFGALSFMINPIFLYLVISDRQTTIGNYKYLLVFFSIFDMTYSGVDMLIPIASHGTRSAFVVYLTDGIFYKDEQFGQFAVSFRCGFIGLSYGILAIHFIYRYSLLFNNAISKKIRKHSGLCYLLLFAFLHGFVWALVGQSTLYSDSETNAYVCDSFERLYDENSSEVPILVAIYSEVSESIIRRSWAGVFILTGISVYAISLYIILGIRIIQKLAECESLSNITKELYKQLLKALIIQTSIPIFICFTPCFAAWYAPMFHIELGTWVHYLEVIAISAFPFLDPLAIIIVLPNYRNKLLESMKKKNDCAATPSDDLSTFRSTPRAHVAAKSL